MSTFFPHQCPSPDPVDRLAERRAQRWEHVKSLVREDDVWTCFKAHLDLIINARSNALAKLFGEICRHPPADVWELRALVQGLQGRDKLALADVVLECVGAAWLSVAEAVEQRPF
jgi:hypothetical protein